MSTLNVELPSLHQVTESLLVIPKFSVFGSIFFGLPLVSAAVVMGYQYFVADFTRELSATDLRLVSGEIVRTERVSHKKMSPVKQVWIRGIDHPFRFDEMRVGEALMTGTAVEIGVEPCELISPHYAAVDDQHFYTPITARLAGGRVVLDLENHNSRLRAMRPWFPWLTLAIASAGVFLSTRFAVDELARQRGPHKNGGRGRRLKFTLMKP